MGKVRVIQNIAECQSAWERLNEPASLFDLWPVRQCFHEAFGRPPYFVVAERDGVLQGLLALSWIDEADCFGFFPGETWRGETWFEANRILARDEATLQALLDEVPGPAALRYLAEAPCAAAEDAQVSIDEMNFSFSPGRWEHCFATYRAGFPSKTWRKIERELDGFAQQGVAWQEGCLADIDWIFGTNRVSFGAESYFSDERFLGAFQSLVAWLHDTGRLCLTSVRIGGRLAASDIGAVWGDTYVLLAGATSREFPGVAKLINLRHLETACKKRYRRVDFLCGDFGWKQRFRLTPEPYYKICLPAPAGVFCQAPIEAVANG